MSISLKLKVIRVDTNNEGVWLSSPVGPRAQNPGPVRAKGMLVSYWRYWKLTGPPFISGTQQPIHLGETVDEAIARIEFLVTNRRQMALLMGCSGCGKTALLRHVAACPPTVDDIPAVRAHRLSVMGMNSGDLFRKLAHTLVGGKPTDSDWQCWRQLDDFLRSQRAEGGQYLIMLDDAESASAQVQEDIECLVAADHPLTTILGIDQQAVSTLNGRLLDRSELLITLPPWSKEQSHAFLQWALQRVNCPQFPFTDEAVERIHAISGGVARAIIRAAELSLVAAAVARSERVEADFVDQIATELSAADAA